MKTFFTHAFAFHCDEVTAYAILEIAGICDSFQRVKQAPPADPNKRIIGDIGRIYDPSRGLFDHHQGSYLRENTYPYATAGMIWKVYGKTAITRLVEKCSPELAERIFARVDRNFIQGIDAGDTDGAYYVEARCSAGEVNILTLPGIVAVFNNEDATDHEAQATRFQEATNLVGILLRSSIRKAHRFFEVETAFDAHTEDRGHYLILRKYLPWMEIVHERYPKAVAVIHPDDRSSHVVRLVTTSPKRREYRRGSGIERPAWFKGFIHENGFLAACDSLEEAIRLAEDL